MGYAGDNILSLIAGGTNSLNIISSGNVGIGTTTPSSKLQVLGTTEQLRLNYDASNYWSSTIGATGGLTMQGAGSGGALTLSPTAGQNINFALSGTGDFAVNTNQLYVDTSTGYVGVGTASPAYKLDVAGNVGIDEFIYHNGDPNTYLRYTDDKISLIAGDYYVMDATGGYSGYVKIGAVNNIADVSLQSQNGSLTLKGTTGNIGIGTTSPSTKLDVWGNMQVGTSSTPALFVNTATGNVGIGTSTPTDKLSVIGNITSTNSGGKISINGNSNSPEIWIDRLGTNNYGQIIYRTAGVGKWLAGLSDSDIAGDGSEYFIGQSVGGGSPSLWMETNGNIGIGTTTPTQQLEITKNFALPTTVGTTPYGIIYKGTTPFIHDFSYGLNGNGITPNGQNTFVGLNAGNLTMGSTATYTYESSQNTAIGFESLRANTKGASNTAVGYRALFYNTTGIQNTANGVSSLFYNTTGHSNTANGHLSLNSNTTGIGNIALGYYSGKFLADGTTGRTTGDYGTYLGYNTKASADGTTNETVIGYNATGLGSNTVVLGNDSIVTTALKGNVGIGTTTPASKLDVWGNMQVGTSSTPTLFVNTATGRVGIGTTVPEAPLNVLGSAFPVIEAIRTTATTNDFSSGMELITRTSGVSADGFGGGFVFALQDSNITNNTGGLLAAIGAVRNGGVNTGDMVMRTYNSGTVTEKMRITSGGLVGIGTTTPAYTLHVEKATTGTIAYFKAGENTCSLDPANVGGLSCSSDQRLKTNIQPLALSSVSSSTLDKIVALRPVTYNWITDSKNPSPTEYTGFIAQEVLPLFPDLVSTDNGGNYQLSYSGFIPYIVGAIQDLNNKIVSAVTGIFEKVQTKELCLEDVCLTKTELKALLEKNNITPPVVIPDTDSSQDSDATSDDDTSITDSTTTDPVIIEPQATSTPDIPTASDTEDTPPEPQVLPETEEVVEPEPEASPETSDSADADTPIVI